MAVYSNSTLSGKTIPSQLWDTKLLLRRYAVSTIMPRVLNKSAIVRNMGEIVTIEIEPKLSEGTVTAGTGQFTPSNDAPTEANITIDTWRYVSREITGQARAQSFWDPTSDGFTSEAGKALAEGTDSQLADLHSSVDAGNVIGTEANPETFDDTVATSALLKLEDRNVPKDGLSFVLHPAAWLKGWLAKIELAAANSTGLAKSLVLTGERTPILGVPSFVTTKIANVNGTRKGLLLHKESMGVAFQINHDYEVASRVPAGFIGKIAVVHDLRGVAVVRSDHFVVMNLING